MSQYINPRSKLLRHIDRVAALKHGAKQPPVNVEIDLSNRCSLGCEWCHFAHTHTRGPLAHKRAVDAGDLMDTELAFSIIAQLTDPEYSVRSIVWSGGGEPTLHPDFDVIVSGVTIPQGLYTNGNHITEQRAGLLKQRLSWVYVSLDAVSADDYSAAKGVPPKRFHDALMGISRLGKAEGNATIGVGFLLNADNWHKARDMANLARHYGANYAQFRPAILYKYDAPSEIEGNLDWLQQAHDSLATLQHHAGVEIDVSRFYMYAKWSEHGYPVCWWSGLQAVITPDGRMWACLNKRGYDGACIGDLNTETFKSIWRRAPIQMVNDQCRVMCRGHIPNTQLHAMLDGDEMPHKEFI